MKRFCSQAKQVSEHLFIACYLDDHNYFNNTESIMLETIICQTQKNTKASIIWLHGLGADGHDFAGIVEQFNFTSSQGVRFVFPHAAERPVTINNGYVMRAWFDIRSLDRLDKNTDDQGIEESCRQCEELIAHEISQGVEPQNIFLAGFSQGGVIALKTGLSYAKPLGGIIALSTYFPILEKSNHQNHPANQNIPIFMAHGLFDDVLNFQLGDVSQKHLKNANYKVDWHYYEMPHSVIPQEINDISNWLNRYLP